MKRKLAKGDRLIGPALCCIQNGRMPYFLSRGAALGFYFKNPADPGAVEIQKCVLEEGIGEAVSRFCGLSDDVLAEPAAQAAHRGAVLRAFQSGSLRYPL